MMELVTATGALETDSPSHDAIDVDMSEVENPLTIDLVLKELFRSLSQNDLARCRLVSRQWYEESLPVWRDTATLTLKRGKIIVEQEAEADDGGAGDSYQVSLEQFLDYWATSGGRKPFRQFHLKDWDGQPGLNPFQVVRFWEQIGGHISSLVLTNHQFSCLSEFRKVIYQLCPNMKRLELWNVIVLGTDFLNEAPEQMYKPPEYGEQPHLTSLETYDCCPDSWLSLLSHFPSLQSIEVDAACFRHFLHAVRTVRAAHPRKLPLTEVYFALELDGDPESEEIFQLFRELQLPVQELKTEMGEELDLSQALEDILQEHSQTLEQMTVDYRGALPCPRFPFGVALPQLFKLELNDIGFCNDLHFLRSMPNLTDLRVNRFANSRGLEVFANTDEETMANVSLLKLKKLRLECSMSEEELRRLQRWMPNLEVAALILDNAKFSAVCQNWKNLRGLLDFGNRVTDAGLLGIVRDGEEASLPNLTHLKHLKFFGTKSRHLSQESVTSGFLKMSSLQTVSIHKDSPLMTSGGGRSLREEGITVNPNKFLSFVKDCLSQ